jgi:glycosyltransferase involved in cell wall biosynthesis
MHELLVNANERHQIAADAQREARERFNIERMVEETEKVYAEVRAR